ncbi:hypothetical protein D3C86_2005040 [compost metagenome]
MAGTTTSSIEAHMSSTTLSSKPKIAAIVDGCNSHAFCIALARAITSLNASSKFNVPLATNEENSPKECPATISGLKLSPKTLANITECKKIAG